MMETHDQTGLRERLKAELQATAEALAAGPLAEIEIPESLRANLELFSRLERRVLKEYDPVVCELFDALLRHAIHANEGNPGTAAARERIASANTSLGCTMVLLRSPIVATNVPRTSWAPLRRTTTRCSCSLEA